MANTSNGFNQGINSYNNQRMNRTMFEAKSSRRDYNHPQIEYTGVNTFSIGNWAMEDDDDVFPVFTKDYNLYFNINGTWTGDITTREINFKTKTFGVLDQLVAAPTAPTTINNWMLLFAFADIKTTGDLQDGVSDQVETSFKGFGLFKSPIATTASMVVSPGTKGTTNNVVTLATDTAYMFSEGAMILIWGSTSNYNTGIIESIVNKNTMVLTMANFPQYGTNLAAGSVAYTIVQFNRFRPYDIFNKNKNLFDNYDLITGGLHIIDNGAGAPKLQTFEFDYGHWSCADYRWLTTQSINTTPTNYPVFNYFPPTSHIGYLNSTTSSGSSGRWINMKSVEGTSINAVLDGNNNTPHDNPHIDHHPFVIQLYTNTNTVALTTDITGYDERLK